MGNKTSANYNISSFIQVISSEANPSIRPNLTEIKTAMQNIVGLFKFNPLTFENAKVLDKQVPKSDDKKGVLQEKKSITFVRYLTMVPKLIKSGDSKSEDYVESLNLFLEMFTYLEKEKAFLEFFFVNGIESMNDIVTSKVGIIPNSIINNYSKFF